MRYTKRQCVACKEYKPFSEFHKHPENGVRPRCKACRSDEAKRKYDPAWHKAYHEKNRERNCARMREYRLANLEKARADSRAYNAANRETLKDQRFQRTYGITLEQWHAIFAAQGQACQICKSATPRNKKGWHTDHGVTDQGVIVRGILCHHCNTGLGMFNHDVGALRAAIQYLDR